jgi:hypothetical protein
MTHQSGGLRVFPGRHWGGPHFQEVRELAGRPLDLVTMPIGPTKPIPVMRAVHLNPEDAVDAAEALDSDLVIEVRDPALTARGNCRSLVAILCGSAPPSLWCHSHCPRCRGQSVQRWRASVALMEQQLGRGTLWSDVRRVVNVMKRGRATVTSTARRGTIRHSVQEALDCPSSCVDESSGKAFNDRGIQTWHEFDCIAEVVEG